MKLNPTPKTAASSRKGLALVTVLSMMALTTILVLAFFSLTQSEYQASQTYATGQAAKAYADTALNIVISQIRSGAERVSKNTPVIHVTQPGCIRKYDTTGSFIEAYKLYSDANMIYRSPANAQSGERNFFNSTQIPGGWNVGNEIYRYCDMNEPVVRALAGGATGGSTTGVQVYFPVIDPRAAADITSDNSVVPVEGFSYASTQSMFGSSYAISGVVAPGPGGSLDNLRLPMPVQWLYLLKDGSMGTLDSSLLFVGSGGVMPSADNPMVARIAFWTDDECCKVNINTASEPTFMGTPRYYHEREHQWTDRPPTRDEFQRYPGHPATVALSTIFYPNPYQDPSRSLEMHNAPVARVAALVAMKNKIYEIMPRIHNGGSEAGTRVFEEDDFTKGASDRLRRADAQHERLYASVDELMFTVAATGQLRKETEANVPSMNIKLFDRDTLDRASAFLTAQSRASETNMLGYPKIAMWPIADEALGDDRRTRYDRLIAFCSSLNPVAGASNFYYFQRNRSSDPNYDVNVIARNKQLMSMLDTVLATQKFPSSSVQPGQSATFATKYGPQNAKQILVQLFDYIRCTNLYDSVLAPPRDDLDALKVPASNGNETWRDIYIAKDAKVKNWVTFTSPAFKNSGNQTNPFSDKVYPGRGQVASSHWRTGGTVYKGIGRDLTISEVGLHFICTGDGQNDQFSWRIPTRGAPLGNNQYPYDIPLIDETSFDESPALVSGGRTALQFSGQEFATGVHHPFVFATPRGFGPPGKGAYIRSMPSEWRGDGGMKARFYSNYPVLSAGTLGLYGTVPLAQRLPPQHPFYGRSPHAHPGYDPANWNCTLDRDTPLLPKEKRVQAALHLELFTPAVGYTQLFPEFTLVLDGRQVSSIEINGKAMFSTTADIVIKSNNPLYELGGAPEVGGHASFRMLASNRRLRGTRAMPSDQGYDSSATGQLHEGLLNMDLISGFFTVPSEDNIQFNSGEVTVKIFDTHDWKGAEPVQIVKFSMPAGSAPAPDLVVKPSYHVRYVGSNGSIYDHPQVQAPRWWAFHRDGAVGRFVGDFTSPQNAIAPFDLRGRLYTQSVSGGGVTAKGSSDFQRVPGISALMYGRDASNNGVDVKTTRDRLLRIRYEGNDPVHYGSDSVRSLVPGAGLTAEYGHGDARLIAAKAVVSSIDWSPHPLYGEQDVFMAHNMSGYGLTEAGFDSSGKVGQTLEPDNTIIGEAALGESPTKNPAALAPDAVYSEKNQIRARRYGDYDESDPGGRVGAFINKPDEGNYAVGLYQGSGWPSAVKYRSSYFRIDSFGEQYAAATNLFFSPNRLITSPVMFGSLPSNVFSEAAQGAWQTLLFRPHVQFGGRWPGEGTHPGQSKAPADHNLLELFWMPVVEPYAISEPLSTAGKINMNYQMLPFAHIRRATALHALMKGEMFQALPDKDYYQARRPLTGFGVNGASAPTFRDELPGGQNKYWHRKIVIDRFEGESQTSPIRGTLAQFDERFEWRPGLPTQKTGGLFRTPSQICDLYLIPSAVPSGMGTNVNVATLGTYNGRKAAMSQFWTAHGCTGDNTREQPYSNLYARLTTRSNTFRVHVRAETVRKARSSDPTRFDPARDTVAGEYRGSFLIERYIDVNDRSRPLPDYAAGDLNTMEPLESFYRFRVLESKRFSP